MDDSYYDYYALLGLAADADVDAVKRAFVAKAKDLIAAYQTLSDRESRAQYDESRRFARIGGSGEELAVALSSPALIPVTPQAMPSLLNQDALPPDEQNLRNLVVSLDGRTLLPGKKIAKRLLSRIPIDRPVFVHTTAGITHDARLKDLSGTGARLAVAAAFAVDEVVEIGVDNTSPPFVMAQIVRIIRPGADYGVKWIQVYERRLPRGMLSNERW